MLIGSGRAALAHHVWAERAVVMRARSTIVLSAGITCAFLFTFGEARLGGTARIAVARSAADTPGTAQFHRPSGIAVDSSGGIYVTNAGDDTVDRLAPNGLLLGKTTAGPLPFHLLRAAH